MAQVVLCVRTVGQTLQTLGQYQFTNHILVIGGFCI